MTKYIKFYQKRSEHAYDEICSQVKTGITSNTSTSRKVCNFKKPVTCGQVLS